MDRYSNKNRPQLLQIGDVVRFVFDDEIIDYVVEPRYLRSHNSQGNHRVFEKLGMEDYDQRHAFANENYGYYPGPGAWPEYKEFGFEAATRLVNAIFDEIEKLEKKQSVTETKDVSLQEKIAALPESFRDFVMDFVDAAPKIRSFVFAANARDGETFGDSDGKQMDTIAQRHAFEGKPSVPDAVGLSMVLLRWNEKLIEGHEY